jgi:hypothetical protein
MQFNNYQRTIGLILGTSWTCLIAYVLLTLRDGSSPTLSFVPILGSLTLSTILLLHQASAPRISTYRGRTRAALTVAILISLLSVGLLTYVSAR